MKPAPTKLRPQLYEIRNIKFQHTIYRDGSEVFIRNDKLHRVDGPASTDTRGNKFWYVDGELVECNSQEEFEATVQFREWNLKAFS